MRRPADAAERLLQLLDFDEGLKTDGIQFGRFGVKDHIDAGRLAQRDIVVEGPRVAVKILIRAELRGIDEDRRHDNVVVALRLAQQGGMAFVERAHRRHEADRFSRGAEGAERVARFFDRRRHERHRGAFRISPLLCDLCGLCVSNGAFRRRSPGIRSTSSRGLGGLQHHE
jgi:hypothetical protein